MTFPFRRSKKGVEKSPSKMKLKPGEHVKLVTPKKSKKPKKSVTWAKKLENVKNYNKSTTKRTNWIIKSNNQKNTQKENQRILLNIMSAKKEANEATKRAQSRKKLNF